MNIDLSAEALEYGFVDHIITHANFNGSAS